MMAIRHLDKTLSVQAVTMRVAVSSVVLGLWRINSPGPRVSHMMTHTDGLADSRLEADFPSPITASEGISPGLLKCDYNYFYEYHFDDYNFDDYDFNNYHFDDYEFYDYTYDFNDYDFDSYDNDYDSNNYTPPAVSRRSWQPWFQRQRGAETATPASAPRSRSCS